MKTRKLLCDQPIGPEGSEVREHGHDVFDFIIKPGYRRAAPVAYRAD